jgi:hypothetical protein
VPRELTRFLVAPIAGLALAAAALAASPRPVPMRVVLDVDRAVPYANYLPTRSLTGFAYRSWAYRSGVLRITFRDPRGRTIVWTVAPMRGTCRAGMDRAFQLAGNKVWWAQDGGTQRAWRCVFGQDGIPYRLSASSTTPPARLAPFGLGAVAASAKRY